MPPDSYLTVNASGEVGSHRAKLYRHHGCQHWCSAGRATNVLTISDETGDVTVDLSGLSDTDTAGTDDQTLTADRTIFTDGNELRISGASPELVLATDDWSQSS